MSASNGRGKRAKAVRTPMGGWNSLVMRCTCTPEPLRVGPTVSETLHMRNELRYLDPGHTWVGRGQDAAQADGGPTLQRTLGEPVRCDYGAQQAGARMGRCGLRPFLVKRQPAKVGRERQG